MSDLWPDIDPDSDSSNYGSWYEGIKYQDNPENQEQEKVLLFPHMNPRSLIQGDQRALNQLKSDIERSKDKLFFIKHIDAGSIHAK